MSIGIAIAGAVGRMGRRIVALAAVDSAVHVASALETAACPSIGQDVGVLAGIGSIGCPVAAALETKADALIDFTSPAGTLHWLETCMAAGLPIVIGTTGHSADQHKAIKAAASKIAVVKAANMSVGVNVLLRVARLLGQALDDSYDVEISETHHRFKLDAPSGTAIALKEAVVEGRKSAGRGDSPVVYGRQGHGSERPPGEIGMHALRLGDTVGEHTVAFGNLGETLTIGHSAHTRDTFASGAIRAAKWIVGKPAGLYDMQDVLFGRKD